MTRPRRCKQVLLELSSWKHMFHQGGGSNLDRETHGRCARRRIVAGPHPPLSRSARWRIEVKHSKRSCAMSLALRRKGGGRHPALGFYPIFALSVLTYAVRSGFQRMFAHGRAKGRDRATEFFGVCHLPDIISQKEVTTPNNSFSWPSKCPLRHKTFRS